MKRLLIALAIAAVVGVVGLVIACKSALEPRCESRVWSEQASPNGTFVFSLFRRDCGATADYATGLSIRRAGDDFDQSARDEVLLVDGDVPATASWIDADRIEIFIPKGAQIFRSAEKLEGITITYSAN